MNVNPIFFHHRSRNSDRRRVRALSVDVRTDFFGRMRLRMIRNKKGRLKISDGLCFK